MALLCQWLPTSMGNATLRCWMPLYAGIYCELRTLAFYATFSMQLRLKLASKGENCQNFREPLGYLVGNSGRCKVEQALNV